MKTILELENCNDLKKIEEISFNNEIKQELMSENTTKLIDNGEKYLCYLFKVNNKYAGLAFFAFPAVLERVALVDVAIFKEFRGKIGKKLGKMSINKLFNETDINIVLGRIRKSNRKSLFYSLICGFNKLKETKDYYYIGVTKNG